MSANNTEQKEPVTLKKSALATAEAILAGDDEIVLETLKDGSTKKTRIVNGQKIVSIISDGKTAYNPEQPQGRDFKGLDE